MSLSLWSSSLLSNNWWRTLWKTNYRSTLNDQIQLHTARMLRWSFIFPCRHLIFPHHSAAHHWDIFPIIPRFPGGMLTSDRFIVSALLPFSPLLSLSHTSHCSCHYRSPENEWHLLHCTALFSVKHTIHLLCTDDVFPYASVRQMVALGANFHSLY